MKPVNPPSIIAKNWTHEIINSKQDTKNNPTLTTLFSMLLEIDSRIDEFETLIPKLENIKEYLWSTQQRDALIHCYKSETLKLLELKGILSGLITNNICPYCGIQHLGNGYDHYLPKEKYPEFSVYGRNLIPCCNECNSYKGAKLFDSYNNREILHLYFDAIPEQSLLDVDISQKGIAYVADFYIINPLPVQDYLQPVVSNHINNLQLLKRYRLYSSSFFSELRSTILALPFKSDETKVQKFFTDQIEKLGKLYGYNHPRFLITKKLSYDLNTLRLLL